MAAELVIGVVSTRRGDHAPIGMYGEMGAILAAEEINAAAGVPLDGGGPAHPLILVHADDGGTPAGAQEAIASLLARERPFLVLGPDLSALTYPTAHLTRRARVLQFTSALSTRITGLGNPWLFRVRPHNGYRAAAAARLVAERGFQRLALLYLDNELGRDGRAHLERALGARGRAPFMAHAVTGPAVDMRGVVASVRAARADAVCYWGTQPAGAAVLRALRAGGWTGPFLSNTMDDIFLGLAGEAAEGSLGFDCFAPSDPDGRIQDFCGRFARRWGRAPDAHAAASYDALRLLRDAVRAVGADPEAVRARLASGRPYQGVAHRYAFDETGELRGWATVYEIRHGKAVFLGKTQEPPEA